MSQNLSSEEQAKWKQTCKHQREIARCNPCTEPVMATCEDFFCRLGPWNLSLTLDAYLMPPMWHGSISLIKQLGDETVYGPDGKPIFEVPQEGIVAVESWDKEEYDNARDLLGDLFGPLIHSRDQQVIEGYGKGGMVLSWLTRQKDADQRIELVRI